MSALKSVGACSTRSPRTSVCHPSESSYTMATLFSDSSVISASVRQASGFAAITVSNISSSPLLTMQYRHYALRCYNSTPQWTYSHILGHRLSRDPSGIRSSEPLVPPVKLLLPPFCSLAKSPSHSEQWDGPKTPTLHSWRESAGGFQS